MTSTTHCNLKTGKWAPSSSSEGDQNKKSSAIVLNYRSQLKEQPFNTSEQKLIRAAIRQKYRQVAQSANGLFNYQTGRKGAIALGYDSALIDKIPDDSLNSFCGVGNPFALSSILPGSKILDIGCGSGVDLLVAREIVGQSGHVCGIDLTEEMVNNAQFLIRETGYENISVQHVTSEKIPHSDERFDYAISNGVINLSPSKLKFFREIRRVMKPGGIFQFADVCLMEEKVLEQASSPDDWAQWIGGTISVRDQIALLEKADFRMIECVGSSGFKTSPNTEGTLFKALK